MFSEKVIPSDWSDIIVEPIHKKWNKLDPARSSYVMFYFKSADLKTAVDTVWRKDL